MPSYLSLNHCCVSAFLILWLRPIRPLRARRLAMRAHARAAHHHVKVHAVDAGRGVVLEAEVDVLHDAEAKVAVAEKFFFRSSYSFTLRPRSRISSAFSPRIVTCVEIFSLRRMPNWRTV